MKLNWPLVVMWWPMATLVERFTTNMNPSATHDIWVMVYVLAILFSVAIFWYLVIVEIEVRKRGGSVVRFQNALGEVAKIVFLLVSGVAAAVYAYVDWRALPVFHSSLLYDTFAVDTFVGGGFLVAWGITLTMVAAHDLRLLVRKTRTLISM